MTADAPVGGRNFVVHVTRRGPRGGVRDQWELACRQVILPVLRVGEPKRTTIGRPGPACEHDDRPGLEPQPDELLVLRRGHTGATELYDWWTLEHNALLRGSHDVAVTVLDDAGRAVTTWSFTGCHLVALRFSPLDAVDSGVLIESADISFDTVTRVARRGDERQRAGVRP